MAKEKEPRDSGLCSLPTNPALDRQPTSTLKVLDDLLHTRSTHNSDCQTDGIHVVK